MPPVILAVASTLAYVGVASLVESAVLGAILGGIAAWGTSQLGSMVFGLNGQAGEPADLVAPEVWLSNEPGNTAPLPVVYGLRRMGGTIVFAQVTGDTNQYLHVVYAICEGPVDSIGALYLNLDRAPVIQDSTEQQVFSLSGVCADEVTAEFQVLEESASTGSSSGSWATVTAWASGTYGGHLVLDRDYADAQADSQSGPFTYSVATDAGDLADYEAGSTVALRLEETGANMVPFDVELLQAPTEENNYRARVRVRRIGGVSPMAFSFALHATFYTPGQSQWQGLVDYHPHTGAEDQVADALLAARCEGWTSEHRLRGVAYAYIRYRYSADGFPRGVPTATFDVRGRQLYDPRDGSTAYSLNPALAIRDYLTNDRYGRGLPESLVDDAAISVAADYCEEMQDDGYGGQVERYRCRGVVDTSRTALRNMEALLRSCRGWLTHVGGQYRLVLDRAQASSFELNSSNITGGWSITLGDSRSLANRVLAEFYNPDLDWLKDYQPADSPELRAQDGGQLLERKLSLEFVTDPATVYRLALLELNASRQAITVQLDVLPRGLDILPCDVVTIKHDRPGWGEGKDFRVLSMRLRPEGGVRLSLAEYAPEVYTAPEVLLDDPAPDTNLPTPATCAAPATPEATEQLYETRGGRGVAVAALVSWAAPADPYVRSYELEHKLHDDAAAGFHLVETTPATSARVLDVAPGGHSWRVRAVNSLGVKSNWSEIAHQDVVGLSAPPANVSDLCAQPIGGAMVLNWTPHPDLDVQVGGHIWIRHVHENGGTVAWDNGLNMARVAGSSSSAVVALISGTYMARAVDSTGNLSGTPATIEVVEVDHLGMTVAGSWKANPGWSGTHNNTEVDRGKLQLQSGELTGEWTCLLTFNLGSPAAPYRLEAQVATYLQDIATLWDSRTDLIDTWPDIDGSESGDTSVEIWVSSYGATGWGPWQRLTALDSMGYLYKFKVVLSRANVEKNIIVTALTVYALEVV